MPPKGSGIAEEQMRQAQKVAVEYIAHELYERKLVVCLPRLPGGDRSAGGPLGIALERILLEGIGRRLPLSHPRDSKTRSPAILHI